MIFGRSSTPLSDADRWAVALSSMYSGRNDRLAPLGSMQRRMSRFMLRRDWGIDGRSRRKKHDQSRDVLDWLKGSGHRAELAEPGDLEAEQDLLAWDAARLVMVARHAFHAGFIDETEAWSYIRPMALETQPHYPSWAEYGRRFGRGHLRWLTERDPNIDEAIAALQRDAASPWLSLDWNTPLDWAASEAANDRR